MLLLVLVLVSVSVSVSFYTLFLGSYCLVQEGLQPYDSDASLEAVGIKAADVRMLSVYEASLINRLEQLRL